LDGTAHQTIPKVNKGNRGKQEHDEIDVHDIAASEIEGSERNKRVKIWVTNHEKILPPLSRDPDSCKEESGQNPIDGQ
jgi:hypothetical protein